jgi:2-iminobutanoate/2-iminopropanoate deaminase
MRKVLTTGGALANYPLSPAIETEQYVMVSGTVAFDEQTGHRLAEVATIQAETKWCLEMIGKLLDLAGCSLRDVVKTNVYLAEREYYAAMNEAYSEYWDKGEFPTRATLVVGLVSDCRIEIDAIAAKPQGV